MKLLILLIIFFFYVQPGQAQSSSTMVREAYQVPEKKQCTRCSGSGKCLRCNGAGVVSRGVRRSMPGNEPRCASCHGSGNCSQCRGARYITTYTTKYRYVKKEVPSSSYSSSSSNNFSGISSSSYGAKQTTRPCSWCNGSGRVLKETTQNGFSLQGEENGKCSECGEQLYKGKGHKHYNCSHCKGTGKL